MSARVVQVALRSVFLGFALVGAVALLGAAQGATAGSLWTPGPSMFSDVKAREVGDLVTLIIIERAEATHQARTATSQDAEVSLGPGTGLLSVIPLVGAKGGDEASASGSTSRGGTVQAKMTTRVVEVLPGGNLRIEGRQTIVINGEQQEIVVSGIVRARDIAPDNTVLSTYVADAHIVFVGTGPLGEKQRPGILTRLLNWLF